MRILATLADVHRNLPGVPAQGEHTIGERPRTWGHLQVFEQVGWGAFGEAFRAWDTRLDREAALKLLPESKARGSDPASTIIQEGRLFVIVVIVLGVTAIASVAGPAWRATRIDPVIALKAE